MISLIKGASDCSIVVGQNGRVWINGKGCDEGLAAEAIDKIESESHIPGLTDRLGRFFEETKNDADLNESDSEEEVVVESGEEAGKGNNIIDELLE